MVRHPLTKDYVLPETPCTRERRVWFQRANEILGFLYVTEAALGEFSVEHIKKNPPKRNEMVDVGRPGGRYVSMSPRKFFKTVNNGVDILTRQIFVMLYGSFETYLYQMFERSFPLIGKKENILQTSLNIIMGKSWDGKFCAMNEVFNIGYKSSELIDHFSGFEMNFKGTAYKNPLGMLDDLAQTRHKIVHASSIFEKDQLIFVDIENLGSYYFFSTKLTDYVDNLFEKKFGYPRNKIDPAFA